MDISTSCWDSIIQCRKKIFQSNAIAIATVYVILMIDYMLLTAIVPILPEYLNTINKQNSFPIKSQSVENTATTIGQYNSTMLTSATTIDGSNYRNRNCSINSTIQYLDKENFYVGILFASKSLVQGFANIMIGYVVDRIGFNLPILIGSIIMCLSSLLFSFGKTYAVLFSARAIQGLGSASASVAGLAMLADRYSLNEDEKRGQAIGIAFGGLAMGYLIGPVFGSVVYQFAGKEAVFLILAIITSILAGIIFFIYGISIQKRSVVDVIPFKSLLSDPYVLLIIFVLIVEIFGLVTLEAAQPLWMIRTMCSAKWELGVAFLPICLSNVISVNITAVFLKKQRWLFAMIGLLLIGIGCALVPYAKSLVGLIFPGLVHGAGLGIIDSTVIPLMAVLVDTRYKAVYGVAFALVDMSYNVAYVFGPLYAGIAIGNFGFDWLIRGISIVAFLLMPFLVFLRKIQAPQSEETQPILQQSDRKNDYSPSERNGHVVENGDVRGQK